MQASVKYSDASLIRTQGSPLLLVLFIYLLFAFDETSAGGLPGLAVDCRRLRSLRERLQIMPIWVN